MHYTGSDIIISIGVMISYVIIRRLKLHYTASDIIITIGVMISYVIIRRSKLHYTASDMISHDIIRPIGVMIYVIICDHQEVKLHYTASDIITPIGVMISEAV